MNNKNILLKKLTLTTAAIALTLSQIGCNKKAEIAAASVSTSFNMTTSNKAATVAMKPSLLNLLVPKAMALVPASIIDSSGLSIALTKSWVVIKEVEFKTSETTSSEESSSSEVSFKGPYYVDLLSNAPPALDVKTIPATPFQRIKMKLEKTGTALPSGAPSELASNSIFIAGTIGSGGSAVSFTYASDDDSEYQISGPKAVTPKEGTQILVEINFSNIFKQINMSTVTNGEAISSSNRHAGSHLCDNIDTSANDIYTCIRKGLEKHADVGEDSDKSGDLESDESGVKR